MKNIFFFALIIALTSCQNSKKDTIPKYPVSIEKYTVEETIFNTTLIDDYRNIESLKDSAVTNWIHKENKYTQLLLNKISKRKEISSQIKEEKSKKTIILEFLQMISIFI
ncbi:MAG: hypothetical protein COB98_08650 [Flavobacteriaceae bacterium]|nr:MAG: hypothetical protein COB98_08650 [Flavobacteriaceae bacterium]